MEYCGTEDYCMITTLLTISEGKCFLDILIRETGLFAHDFHHR